MAVPHILEEITASGLAAQVQGQWIDTLQPLQFVLSGGGPLKDSVGKALADSGVRLIAHLEATQCGPLAPVFVPTPGADYDWRYIRLRSDISHRYSLDQVNEGGFKLTMRPFGWDEPFEAAQMTLIVLANGEKVLPRVLESLLCEDERVKAAVAFGEGHFQTGVIVEPSQSVDMDEIDAFKSGLGPVIVEAGKWIDSHAQISSLTGLMMRRRSQTSFVSLRETVGFATVDGIPLFADIYYPPQKAPAGSSQPIALMIHGGGHIMLSRKDIRPSQTKLLLAHGFLPVSVDYRLCPEVSLTDGPIPDVCTALSWARNTLSTLQLQRPDIRPRGDKVVVVGWSTGGTLSMTFPFSTPQRGIQPLDAVLAFYCPTDYEDQFWRNPNYPEGTSPDFVLDIYDLLAGVQDHSITAYNVPAHKRADGPAGGWMSLSDARSRIALHMNWKGQTLPVLLDALPSKNKLASQKLEYDAQKWLSLPQPDVERVRAVSPYAQIRAGNYEVLTFLIHGMKDDLIPRQQSQQTADMLAAQKVPSGIAVVEDAVHLFDLFRDPEGRYREAIARGFQFLVEHVR
ncbi:Alpha/Beta hydrolase protein [Aspergillus fruticulosus]